jgi:drug/metabolite transporter (DMT)-like permease
MTRLPLSFYLQVLICATLWGSAFPVIKNSYQFLHLNTYGEQLLFAGSRFVLAGLMILPFCRRSILNAIRNAPSKPMLGVILGQTYFQYVFFYFAISVSSATLGSLLVGAGSFWWILLAPILGNAPKPNRSQWLLLGVCSIGIAIAAYAPGAGAGKVLLGCFGFLAATLAGAVGSTYMKAVAPISGSRSSTAVSLAIGGLLLLLTGIGSTSEFIDTYTWKVFGVTVYLAFLSATAFTLWNRLIERYSVSLLSTYRFLIPLMGVIESAIFVQGESIGPGIIIGGLLILGSLIAISREPMAQHPPSDTRTT